MFVNNHGQHEPPESPSDYLNGLGEATYMEYVGIFGNDPSRPSYSQFISMTADQQAAAIAARDPRFMTVQTAQAPYTQPVATVEIAPAVTYQQYRDIFGTDPSRPDFQQYSDMTVAQRAVAAANADPRFALTHATQTTPTITPGVIPPRSDEVVTVYKPPAPDVYHTTPGRIETSTNTPAVSNGNGGILIALAALAAVLS